MMKENCPYCGKEMELGYVQSRDGITWTPKKVLHGVLASLYKGAIPLENGAADNSNVIYAYKCSECKKVIIDYGKPYIRK